VSTATVRVAEKLTCWAGLTPKHHESDTHVRRGRITKQGSRLVRWAAIESVKRIPKTSPVGVLRERVADREYAYELQKSGPAETPIWGPLRVVRL